MAEQKPLKPSGSVKAPAAWDPAPWEDHIVFALQALQAGVASPDQQKAALDWIIRGPCATYDLSYRPSGDRDTCLCEGKRLVGLQIVKLLNLNSTLLKRTT